MSINPESDESLYPTEEQNAIFNFFFLLVEKYSKTMPKHEAISKACDWLISLGTEIKEKSNQFNEELQHKQKNMTKK